MPATLRGAGEGERHPAGASEIVIKVTGAETAGSFFLAENVVEAGFPGPSLHRHAAMHDMFYVLEGRPHRHGRGRRARGRPGTFLCVPPHAFCNATDAAVRFLNFGTPAGWERYMRELAGAATAGPLTSEVIGRIASRHDLEIPLALPRGLPEGEGVALHAGIEFEP